MSLLSKNNYTMQPPSSLTLSYRPLAATLEGRTDVCVQHAEELGRQALLSDSDTASLTSEVSRRALSPTANASGRTTPTKRPGASPLLILCDPQFFRPTTSTVAVDSAPLEVEELEQTGELPSQCHKEKLSKAQKSRRESFRQRPLKTTINKNIKEEKLENLGISKKNIKKISFEKNPKIEDFLYAFNAKLQSHYGEKYDKVVKGKRICGSGASSIVVPGVVSVKKLSDADVAYYLDISDELVDSKGFKLFLEDKILETYYDFIKKETLPEKFRETEEAKKLLKAAYLSNRKPMCDIENDWMLIGIGDLEIRLTIRIAQEYDRTEGAFQVDLDGDYCYYLDEDPEEGKRHYSKGIFLCHTPKSVGLPRALYSISKAGRRCETAVLKPFCKHCLEEESSEKPYSRFVRLMREHFDKDSDNENYLLAIIQALKSLREINHSDEDIIFRQTISYIYNRFFPGAKSAFGKERQCLYPLLQKLIEKKWHHASVKLLEVMQDSLAFEKEGDKEDNSISYKKKKGLYEDIVNGLIDTGSPQSICQALTIMETASIIPVAANRKFVIASACKACDLIYEDPSKFENIETIVDIVERLHKSHFFFESTKTKESFYTDIVNALLVQKQKPCSVDNITNAYSIFASKLQGADETTKAPIICKMISRYVSRGMIENAEVLLDSLQSMNCFYNEDKLVESGKAWYLVCAALLGSDDPVKKARGYAMFDEVDEITALEKSEERSKAEALVISYDLEKAGKGLDSCIKAIDDTDRKDKHEKVDTALKIINDIDNKTIETIRRDTIIFAVHKACGFFAKYPEDFENAENTISIIEQLDKKHKVLDGLTASARPKKKKSKRRTVAEPVVVTREGFYTGIIEKLVQKQDVTHLGNAYNIFMRNQKIFDEKTKVDLICKIILGGASLKMTDNAEALLSTLRSMKNFSEQDQAKNKRKAWYSTCTALLTGDDDEAKVRGCALFDEEKLPTFLRSPPEERARVGVFAARYEVEKACNVSEVFEAIERRRCSKDETTLSLVIEKLSSMGLPNTMKELDKINGFVISHISAMERMGSALVEKYINIAKEESDDNVRFDASIKACELVKTREKQTFNDDLKTITSLGRALNTINPPKKRRTLHRKRVEDIVESSLEEWRYTEANETVRQAWREYVSTMIRQWVKKADGSMFEKAYDTFERSRDRFSEEERTALAIELYDMAITLEAREGRGNFLEIANNVFREEPKTEDSKEKWKEGIFASAEKRKGNFKELCTLMQSMIKSPEGNTFFDIIVDDDEAIVGVLAMFFIVSGLMKTGDDMKRVLPLIEDAIRHKTCSGRRLEVVVGMEKSLLSCPFKALNDAFGENRLPVEKVVEMLKVIQKSELWKTSKQSEEEDILLYRLITSFSEDTKHWQEMIDIMGKDKEYYDRQKESTVKPRRLSYMLSIYFHEIEKNMLRSMKTWEDYKKYQKIHDIIKRYSVELVYTPEQMERLSIMRNPVVLLEIHKMKIDSILKVFNNDMEPESPRERKPENIMSCVKVVFEEWLLFEHRTEIEEVRECHHGEKGELLAAKKKAKLLAAEKEDGTVRESEEYKELLGSAPGLEEYRKLCAKYEREDICNRILEALMKYFFTEPSQVASIGGGREELDKRITEFHIKSEEKNEKGHSLITLLNMLYALPHIELCVSMIDPESGIQLSSHSSPIKMFLDMTWRIPIKIDPTIIKGTWFEKYYDSLPKKTTPAKDVAPMIVTGSMSVEQAQSCMYIPFGSSTGDE